MFNSITWEIFFVAILVIAIVYYVITALLLFYGELISLVKSRSGSSPISPLRETEKIESPDNLMGGIGPVEVSIEPRISSVNVDAIEVASQDEIQENIELTGKNSTSQSGDHLLVGSIADLLEEIKILIQLIAEYKSTKTESQAFFHALFIRYPQLLGTSYQEAVSLYVFGAARDQFSFELSLPEITTWWTKSAS